MLDSYRMLEALSSASPADLELAARARARWEEFRARREGYQLIFFVSPQEALRPSQVVEQLAQTDIRRWGGARGYWRRWLALEEEQERRKKQEGRERFRAALDEGIDRLKAGRKDWYAGGELAGSTPYVPKPKLPDPSKSLTAPVVEAPVDS